jgi:hypothetical protein
MLLLCALRHRTAGRNAHNVRLCRNGAGRYP